MHVVCWLLLHTTGAAAGDSSGCLPLITPGPPAACLLLAGEAAGGVSCPTLVLYPMKCPNRAAERRPEVIQVLRQAGYERVMDMSGHEKRDKAYFEGTGGACLMLCLVWWRVGAALLTLSYFRLHCSPWRRQGLRRRNRWEPSCKVAGVQLWHELC
jgi:hypothetical protein